MKQIVILFFLIFFDVPIVNAQVNYNDFTQWQQIKGAHFIVLFLNKGDEPLANQVSVKAEEYYNKVAHQLGYSRYGNFWTWEERVKIFIFPDQLSFALTTGQPLWSKGYSTRDSKLFESRAIVSFKQEDDFTEKTLPHEIGHLIFKDLVGFNRPIPVWFHEGVAQLQEKSDELMDKSMTVLVKDNQFIPFDLFNDIDIRQEKDQHKVSVFYAQSRSVVEFLIKVYGQEAFQRLCHNLRDGMGLPHALSEVYAPSIDSMTVLGQKWVEYMKEK